MEIRISSSALRNRLFDSQNNAAGAAERGETHARCVGRAEVDTKLVMLVRFPREVSTDLLISSMLGGFKQGDSD